MYELKTVNELAHIGGFELFGAANFRGKTNLLNFAERWMVASEPPPPDFNIF